MLIHRKKPLKEYWVIPGGKIEDGESRYSAAFREIFEELNISENDVRIIDHFDVVNRDRMETYFIGEIESPINFSIHGEELIRSNNENIYIPEWIEISEMKDIELYPSEAKRKIVDINRSI